MEPNLNINYYVDLYKKESANVVLSLNESEIVSFCNLIIDSYEKNHKLFAIGNGGNAAYCSNLVTDLNLHPFVSEDKSKPIVTEKRFRAFNLCADPSTITGISNDFGSDHIFKEQLKFLADSGDVVFGISGSGNSQNILEAFQWAKEHSLSTVLITRKNQGKIHEFSDIKLVVPGDSTFPGQTGGNNNNFHFEDCVSKISHMATGILLNYVKNRR